MKIHHPLCPATLLLLGFASVAQGRGYFAYSYKNIDVMAGDAEYARTLAHNVHRLDVAARKLVEWDRGAPLPPTHLYALHHEAFAKLVPPLQYAPSFQLATHATSEFVISGGEDYAIVDAAAATDYSGADFGLAGSILSSEGLRYPAWFSTGFARLIAPAQIRGTKVILGRVDAWLADVVTSPKLTFVSTRLLLTMRSDDQLLKRDLMEERYTAECWLLVHLITIEGMYKSEFTQYLRLLDAGKDPSDAFAASFKVSYDDLDKMLKDAIGKGSIRSLSFDVPDESDTDQPRQLSVAESDGRIARLSEIMHTGSN